MKEENTESSSVRRQRHISGFIFIFFPLAYGVFLFWDTITNFPELYVDLDPIFVQEQALKTAVDSSLLCLTPVAAGLLLLLRRINRLTVIFASFSIFIFTFFAILASVAALAFGEAGGVLALGPLLAILLCIFLFRLNRMKDIALGFGLALAVLMALFFMFA